MIFSLDTRDARPLYVQIMDEVKRGRVTGAVAADEVLPSVRQLAAELRVNPNTVSQAYRELEREGIVYVRRGQGTFVAAGTVNGAERRELARAVASRARRDAVRHGLDVGDLVEALRRLEAEESGAAGSAATRRRGRPA